jgi:hypothetical protein
MASALQPSLHACSVFETRHGFSCRARRATTRWGYFARSYDLCSIIAQIRNTLLQFRNLIL